MKIRIRATGLLVILSLIGISCSDVNNPVTDNNSAPDARGSESSSDMLLQNITSDPIPLNNYLVTFNGKSYDVNTDQSTFSYTVSGTGVEPALNYLSIETPVCAGPIVGYSPLQSAKVSQSEIIWESSIPSNGSQDYSITYSGDLPVGMVDAASQSGNIAATAEIPGPCKGIFTISGSVFVDGNGNGVKNFSESGIRNVTVHLLNAEGIEFSQKTSSDGYYEFLVFTGSKAVNFDVEVRATTDDTTDFNEQLFDGYTSTNPSEIIVAVNQANQSGIDFGFEPQTEKLILQFEDGTIALNTEEPKFWIQQLRFAQKNNSKAEIPADELVRYLEVIEELFLADPFQLGDDKVGSALQILTNPVKTDLEALLVQLLTAELNVVSGRGSGSLDFDLALLAYGESAANELVSGSIILQKSISVTTTEVSASLSTSTSDAQSLLTSFNFSGGGGGVGNNR